MKLYRAICDCGYSRDGLKSQARAEAALKRHSCKRRRKRSAS